ncbi:MAG: hypothetical protein O2948_04850 [Proteobacteria bacterium]|nr:hypothetical protein [Pseudomonadota bacterium]MDA0926451.1 hypothetical protein [Pseudomonadota bacterium]
MNSKQGNRPQQSVYQVGNATIDIASRQILFDGTPAEVQPRIK